MEEPPLDGTAAPVALPLDEVGAIRGGVSTSYTTRCGCRVLLRRNGIQGFRGNQLGAQQLAVQTSGQTFSGDELNGTKRFTGLTSFSETG